MKRKKDTKATDWVLDPGSVALFKDIIPRSLVTPKTTYKTDCWPKTDAPHPATVMPFSDTPANSWDEVEIK